jgi:hypothetical protein
MKKRKIKADVEKDDDDTGEKEDRMGHEKP